MVDAVEAVSWVQDGGTTTADIGALISTYTILVVPYYNYSIMGPKTPF